MWPSTLLVKRRPLNQHGISFPGKTRSHFKIDTPSIFFALDESRHLLDPSSLGLGQRVQFPSLFTANNKKEKDVGGKITTGKVRL